MSAPIFSPLSVSYNERIKRKNRPSGNTFTTPSTPSSSMSSSSSQLSNNHYIYHASASFIGIDNNVKPDDSKQRHYSQDRYIPADSVSELNRLESNSPYTGRSVVTSLPPVTPTNISSHPSLSTPSPSAPPPSSSTTQTFDHFLRSELLGNYHIDITPKTINKPKISRNGRTSFSNRSLTAFSPIHHSNIIIPSPSSSVPIGEYSILVNSSNYSPIRTQVLNHLEEGELISSLSNLTMGNSRSIDILPMNISTEHSGAINQNTKKNYQNSLTITKENHHPNTRTPVQLPQSNYRESRGLVNTLRRDFPTLSPQHNHNHHDHHHNNHQIGDTNNSTNSSSINATNPTTATILHTSTNPLLSNIPLTSTSVFDENLNNTVDLNRKGRIHSQIANIYDNNYINNHQINPSVISRKSNNNHSARRAKVSHMR